MLTESSVRNMAKKKILVLVEGEKTDARVMEKLFSFYPVQLQIAFRQMTELVFFERKEAVWDERRVIGRFPWSCSHCGGQLS